MKRLSSKMKKIIPLILILSLLINILLPIGGAGMYIKAAGGEDLGNIFNHVTMTDSENIVLDLSKPLEITEDTSIKLLFEWYIPNTVNMSDGDYATIAIPDVFKPIKDAEGALINSTHEEVGRFSITKDTGILKVVFNQILATGGAYEEERNGTVGIVLEFNISKFEDNTNQEVVFDYTEGLKLNIMVKPKSDKTSVISKTETHEPLNPKEVDWTIDVNTAQNEINEAVLKDRIPAGLQLVENSVVVRSLSVGYSGNLTVVTSAAIGYDYNIDTNDLTVELGPLKNVARRIEYKTKIIDYTKPEYKNAAALYDGEAKLGEASKTIDKFTRSALIEKSGSAPAENATKVTWTINVNKAQSVISGAAIKDEISVNQIINNKTIKVYRLNKSGSNWTQGVDVTSSIKGINILDTDDNLQFPISLGNLNGEAYQIVYDADVVSPANFYDASGSSAIKVTNKAILSEEGTEQGSSEDSKIITRGALIDKSGISNPNYSKKEITWTIVANAGNQLITGATVHDKLPVGLTLKPSTVKVTNAKGEIVSDIIVSGVDAEGKFTIALGNITDKRTITYDTVIDEAFYGTKFSNKAWLTGSGTGIGPGTSELLAKDTDITPNIKNTYEKGTLGVSSTKTFGGISYNGMDYDKKTMSWQLAVKPMKRTVTELTITDTFTNKGMVFLPDTLRIQKGTGTTALVLGVDYTIEPATDGTTGYQHGFILKLAAGKEWSGADYYIYFKTTFDLNTPGIIKNTDKIYMNRALFEGKTSDGNFSVESQASYGLSDTASDNGKKEGVLNKNTREITWSIYTNYLSLDDGNNIIIQDVFSEGQQLVPGSLTVTKYKLNAGGTATKDGASLVLGTDYTVTPAALGFNISISKNTGDPYIIEYKTQMLGLSKKEYTNTATVTKGGVTKDYNKTVPHNDYNKFITKKATDVDNTTVYPDDEINWKVELNTSLSEIKEAEFTDVVSAGHVYVRDSLKVYEVIMGNEIEVASTAGVYTLEEPIKGATPQTLKVKFNNTITSKYVISYKTVVIATNGKITNSAKLTGVGVNASSNANNGSGYTVSQLVFGTGGGTTNKGSFTIKKMDKDSNALITAPAEFELFYYLNGDKIIVSGSKQQTKNGILEYKGLSYRTYYLKEVTPPNGYYLADGVKEIVVSAINKNSEAKVFNEAKKSIKVIKTDAYNNSQVLSGAEFALVKTDENGIETTVATKTTDSHGEILFTNLEYGNYKLIETKQPEGYQMPENRETVIGEINTDSSNPYSINLKNERVKTLKIVKVNKEDNDEKLVGAEFKLFTLSGTQIGGIYTSDIKGEVEIKNLSNGTYKLEEIEPPVGFQLPKNPETIIIINATTDETSDGNKDNIITEVIENTLLKTIKIIKVDQENTNKKLPGATFEVYDSAGKMIGTYTTDELGEFKISGLKVGNYSLKETKAPKGYKLPENPVTQFEITHDMEYDTVLPSIGNEVYRSIKIIKVDSENNETVLEGTEFELWKNGIKVADNIVTDSKGFAEIPELLLGSYKLVETKASEGYIKPEGPKAETEIEIQVGNPLEIPVTVKNDLKRKLVIRKVDSSDSTKLLKGAEFIVTGPNGYESTVTTKEDGTVTLSELVFGDYVITETKAPTGYNTNATPNKVTIDEKELIFTVEIKNSVYVPGVVIPVIPYTPTVTPTPSVTPTPTTPVVTPPTVTPVPTNPVKPTPSIVPKPTTPQEPIIEITPEDTPKGGNLHIPDGSKPSIGETPKNGSVAIDEKGKWIYTPNKEFTGKDDFEIIITHPDGSTEEVLIEVIVDEVPLGTIDSSKDDKGGDKGVHIPKTGENKNPFLYFAIILGLVAGTVIVICKYQIKKSKKYIK